MQDNISKTRKIYDKEVNSYVFRSGGIRCRYFYSVVNAICNYAGRYVFFLIRPQQAQQKERQAMIDGLAKGDKIVSIGGIHGEITAISDDHIKLKIADGTVISLSKSGVGSVIS